MMLFVNTLIRYGRHELPNKNMQFDCERSSSTKYNAHRSSYLTISWGNLTLDKDH